jgi:hypothetical protein
MQLMGTQNALKVLFPGEESLCLAQMLNSF